MGKGHVISGPEANFLEIFVRDYPILTRPVYQVTSVYQVPPRVKRDQFVQFKLTIRKLGRN